MDKLTTESPPHGGARRLDPGPGDMSAMPRQQIELPALAIEDDDCGGDPYNRTGQFCLADLKKRDR